MVWVIRTFDNSRNSGFKFHSTPIDKDFDDKEKAITYRSKLKCHSEMFEKNVDKSRLKS